MLELILASYVLGNAVQLLEAFVPSQEVNNQVSSLDMRSCWWMFEMK